MTIGMSDGIGKIHISNGDIIKAPPNPLSRLTNPPAIAEKINTEIDSQASRFKQPRLSHARQQCDHEFADEPLNRQAYLLPFFWALERE